MREGVNRMLKFANKFMVTGACLIIASIAMIMTTACVSIYHEPEMPEELKK
jgi:cyclic lactone autoinducer peptide